MAEYQHSGHTKYDIKYHIVWITKYRYKVVTKEIGMRLKELLIQGCQCRGITIVGGHIGMDHVHLLLSCPPDLSVSKIVQYLKGRSSRFLQDEYPQLKKLLGAAFVGERIFLCNDRHNDRRND